MDIRQVESVEALFDVFMDPAADGPLRTIYRGVSDSRYQLIPSLGRLESLRAENDDRRRELESSLIDDFRKFARPYFESGTIDDWELFGIAQHHGLPTRLLDWTKNPLVAAYFAVESLSPNDCSIFTYSVRAFTSTAGADAFDIETTMTVELPHVTRRITAQSGLFTVSSDPFVAMDDQPDTSPHIVKYVLPAALKRESLRRLHRLGMNRATLFPGTEGIAQHLRWEIEHVGGLV